MVSESITNSRDAVVLLCVHTASEMHTFHGDRDGEREKNV